MKNDGKKDGCSQYTKSWTMDGIQVVKYIYMYKHLEVKGIMAVLIWMIAWDDLVECRHPRMSNSSSNTVSFKIITRMDPIRFSHQFPQLTCHLGGQVAVAMMMIIVVVVVVVVILR
jgi:hypothetical protein